MRKMFEERGIKRYGRKGLAFLLAFLLAVNVLPENVLAAAMASADAMQSAVEEQAGGQDNSASVSEGDKAVSPGSSAVSEGDGTVSGGNGMVSGGDGTEKVPGISDEIPERVAAGTDFDLRDLIVGATLGGEDIVVEGDTWKTVRPGVTYDMSLSFMEGATQFVDDDTAMVYNLPEGVTAIGSGGLIDITVSISGNTYVVNDNQFIISDDGKTLKLILNIADEDFQELIQTNNAQFSVNFKAEFSLENGDQELDFGNEVKKTVTVDGAHDASVEKWGYFNTSDGKMHYTVTVSSDGVSKNISVKDTITGDALALDTDSITVRSSDGQSIGYTVNADTSGFEMTIAELGHNQKAYIEYTASLDADQIGPDGKITAQGNEVKIECEDDDDDSDADNKKSYTQDLTVSSVQGKSGAAVKGDDGYAVIDENNKATVEWTIRVNSERLIALNGKPIQDTIRDDQTYSGTGITVKKTDKDGNVTTETIPWSDLTAKDDTSWTYTPTDTEAYYYEITYTTLKDVGDQLQDLTVNNKVTYLGNDTPATGLIGIDPENKLTVEKSAVDVANDKIVWEIKVNVPKTGYSSFEVKDTYPEQGNINVVEGLLAGADIEVEGMDPSESYVLDTTESDKYFKLTFSYQDANNDTKPGLIGTGESRTLKIRVTTEVNAEWLEFGRENSWAAAHKNHVDVTANALTKPADAYAYPSTDTTVKKKGEKAGTVEDANGNKYTYYRYEVTVSPVNRDPIVVKDILPEGFVFYKTAKASEYMDNLKPAVYGGDQWYQGMGSGDSVVTLADDGTITASDLPMNGSAYYGYYKIVYYIIPKDLDALKDLNQRAYAAGGTITLTNTATYDGVAAGSDVEYTVDKGSVIDKKLLNKGELSSSNHNAKYELVINPLGLTLNNGDPLVLTDTFTNLSIDYNSIEFTPGDAVLSCDVSGSTLTAVVKDATPIVLTYMSRVNGNAQVNFSNTASMAGYTVVSDEDVDFSSGNAGQGSASVPSINILKYEGGNILKRLSGVSFALFIADGDVPVVDNTGAQVTVTTDSEGMALIQGRQNVDGWVLETGVKYYVQEINPPAGFARDDTKYTFTIAADNVADYDNWIYYDNDNLKVKNWPAVNSGSLKVTKTLAGQVPDDLDLGSVKLKVTAGGTEYVKTLAEIAAFASTGSADFTYDPDNKIYTWTLSGLPQGEAVVTEEVRDVTGYTLTKTYTIGTGAEAQAYPDAGVTVTVGDTLPTVNLTNSYAYETAKIRIRKNVRGVLTWDLVKTHLTFEIKADPANAVAFEDKIIRGDADGWTDDGSGQAVYEIEVPVGSYTVTEINTSGLSGYIRTTTVDGEPTTVNNEAVSGRTDSGTVTAGAGDEKEIAFVNTYKQQGSLKLKKTITSPGNKVTWDKLKEKGDLYFEVEGPINDPEEPSVVRYIFATTDGWDETGNNPTYTLTELPIGNYRITEKQADVEYYNRMTTVDGNAGNSATVEITANNTGEVAVANTYTEKKGKLIVKKTIKVTDDTPLTAFTAESICNDTSLLEKIVFTITGEDGTEYGPRTITLNATDFDHSGNTFTMVLEDIPAGKYRVTETRYDLDEGESTRIHAVYSVEYTIESSVDRTGPSPVTDGMENGAGAEIRDDGETVTVAVTDTYSTPTATLTLVKAVEGNGAAPLNVLADINPNAVIFEIYRSSDNGASWELYRKVTPADLTSETLPTGQTVWKFVADYMPMGMYYVKETVGDVAGYRLLSTDFTVKGDSGNYTTDGEDTSERTTGRFKFADGEPNTETVTYTNTYEKLASLKIQKQVTSDGDMNWDKVKGSIRFEITGPNGYRIVVGGSNPRWNRIDANNDIWEYELTDLKQGSYTVKEIADGVPRYTMTTTITDENGTGLAADTTGTVTLAGADAAELDQLIRFVNHYELELGNLIITKTLAAESGNDKPSWDAVKRGLSFKISGPDDFAPVTISGTQLTESPSGSGIYRYRLENLPVGSEYRVEETAADPENYGLQKAHYQVTVGTTASGNGDSLVTGDITVRKDTDTTVSFTNTYKRGAGRLVIQKIVAGDRNWDQVKDTIVFEVLDGDDKTVGTVYGTADGWTKNGNVYTYTLFDLDAGAQYTVVEKFTTEDPVYTRVTKVAVNAGTEREATRASVTITNTGANAQVRFTNTYAHVTGKLMIVKTLKGGVAAAKALDAVKFKVTNNDTGESDDYTLRDFTYNETSKKYELELDPVPTGGYTVEETAYTISGYSKVTVTYSVNGAAQKTGSKAPEINVGENRTTTVEFVNTYSGGGGGGGKGGGGGDDDDDDDDDGKLLITKTLKGDASRAEAENTLKFRVMSNNSLTSETYTLKDFTYNEAAGRYERQLVFKAGGYTVQEIVCDIDGYETVAVTYQVNSETAKNGNSVSVSLSDEQTTVAFTDEYKKSNKKSPRTPKTGDDSPLVLWSVLLAFGMMGMIGAAMSLTSGKRRQRSERQPAEHFADND